MTIRTSLSFCVALTLFSACNNDIPFYYYGDIGTGADTGEGDATGTDVSGDADQDVGESDTDSDASADVVEDAPADAVADAPADVAEDAEADAVEDAEPDSVEDTEADGIEDTEPDAERVCEPNTRFCADDYTVDSCNADGTARTLTDCDDGEFCLAGECLGQACEPDSAVCDGDDLLVCDALGTGYDVNPCDEEPRCLDSELGCSCVEDTCAERICEPGSTQCDGESISTCLADGMGFEVGDECAEGCVDGECVETCPGLEGPSHLGCSFWSADFDNYGSNDTDPYTLMITNGGAGAASVRVTRSSDGRELWAGVVFDDEPAVVQPGTTDLENTTLTSNSFHISSDVPVSVAQYNPLDAVAGYSADSSLLLPQTVLGREYVVLGWPSVPPPTELRSWMSVIAVGEGETNVELVTTVTTLAGSGVAAIADETVFTLSMEQGEVLTISTEDAAVSGFSGTTVSASQNVAVFSGSECARVPLDNDFCDMLEEQLRPVATWGEEYVGAKFRPRGAESDVWRVVASEDGTTISTTPSLSGADGVILGEGEYLEFETASSFVLTSSAPVDVGQFMVGARYPAGTGSAIERACSGEGGTGFGDYGDPAFSNAVSTSQFLEEYRIEVPITDAEHYLTLVVPDGESVEITGAATAVGTDSAGPWQVLYYEVEPGTYELSGTAPFGAYTYGYDCNSSYAHPAGTRLLRR